MKTNSSVGTIKLKKIKGKICKNSHRFQKKFKEIQRKKLSKGN